MSADSSAPRRVAGQTGSTDASVAYAAEGSCEDTHPRGTPRPGTSAGGRRTHGRARRTPRR
eukprot:5694734-Pleurochrysis_carterae.AAC.1